MSDQSPYDASTGGLSRLADSVKQRRTDEYVRRLEADRDRLAAELATVIETRDWLTDRVSKLEDAAETAGFAAGEEIEKLQAELAQARAALAERGTCLQENAARYRWLRENDETALYSDYWAERLNERDIAQEQIAGELDAAIDAKRTAPSAGRARPCTCHPDDNPPVPCPRKYALSECRAASTVEGRHE